MAGAPLAQAAGPSLVFTTLPDPGTPTSDLIDTIQIGFSAVMLATTVTNPANYELRGSANGDFEDADDWVYSLLPKPYGGGLTLTLTVVDGPLRPGFYRFSALSGLQDASGTPMASPDRRRFTALAAEEYLIETQGNDVPTGASPLGLVSTRLYTLGAPAEVALSGVGSASPSAVVGADLNSDGRMDLVFADEANDRILIVLGLGGGGFQAPASLPVGGGPNALAVGDLNGDGIADLVVAHHGGASVGILSGQGDGTFAALQTVGVGAQPNRVRMADLDGDSQPEIIVANEAADYATVLRRQSDQTFARTDISLGGGTATSVAVGDLNGDTQIDIAVASAGTDTVTILLNTGDGSGTFTAPVSFAAGDGPVDIEMGDLNGDGRTDVIVLASTGAALSVLRGIGDGSLQPPVSLPGIPTSARTEVVADLDGDGSPEIVVAGGSSGDVVVFRNRRDGTFMSGQAFHRDGIVSGLAVGDWNGDGLVDLTSALSSPGGAALWLGEVSAGLSESPSGVFTGAGRGTLAEANDVDYWRFAGQTGDLVSLAVETPGALAGSQLLYRIEGPGSVQLTEFVANSDSGWGQSVPTALPLTGEYRVSVRHSDDFRGEYRVRATLVRNGIQMENENGDNDSTATADVPSFVTASGVSFGTIHGYLGIGDTAGDYYRVGDYPAGASVALVARRPATSQLSAIVELYRSAGGGATKVAESTVGTEQIWYNIPTGGAGTYFARVRASSGAGLMAQYLLDVGLIDSSGPTVTSISLPAEGTTSDQLIKQFTVAFSAAMDTNSLANPANYELLTSVNDSFGDGDDITYALACTAQADARGATCRLLDGPVQAGRCRLVVRAGLRDASGHHLFDEATRNFTLTPSAGIVVEGRDNSSFGKATVLGDGTGGLIEDPPRLLTGLGLGSIDPAGDEDYWSFSAAFGDQLTFAGELSSNGGQPVTFTLYNPAGASLASITTGSGRWAKSGVLTLTTNGLFRVGAKCTTGTQDEYRVRVSLARDGLPFEAESNGTIGLANRIVLQQFGGLAFGSVAGDVNLRDPSWGDYFVIGGASESVAIDAAVRTPTGSGLHPTIGIFRKDGSLAAASDGAAGVHYVVPAGEHGTYYARVTPAVPQRPGNPSGKHLAFDGSGGYMEVPLDIPEDEFTVAFWFYAGADNVGLFEAGAGQAGANGHDRQIFLSGGNLYAAMHAGQTIGSTGLNLVDGQWHHVVYTYGSSIPGQRLYVDGAAVASGSKGASEFTWQDRVDIGFVAGYANLVGALEDVSLWIGALSPARIQQLLVAPPAGTETDLLAYWPLNTNSGMNVVDASGHGHTGSLSPGVACGTSTAGTQPDWMHSQYVLDIGLSDSLAPHVVSLNLPAEGTTVQQCVEAIALVFSEEMLPTTVTNRANYSLRQAGADGLFQTADDLVYHLSEISGYTNGLSAQLQIDEGPLPPGNYRFAISSAVTDWVGNPLADSPVRQFTIAAMPGYVLERRNNQTLAGAAPLGVISELGSDGTFNRGISAGVGSAPHMIAAADLNGDGHLDLVTTEYYGNQMSVLLGDGGGSFGAASGLPMGQLNSDLILLDINRDGKPDALTASYSSGNVSIRLGLGDGTFGVLRTLNTGGSPNGLAAGDFDRDGMVDLAVASRLTGTISIWRGNGDGTFQNVGQYTSGAGAARLTATDFNTDGILDLAVANYFENTVSVFIGNGAGQFQRTQQYATGNGPYWVSAQDVDADGKTDLAVANIAQGTINIFRGLGNGTFAPKVDYPTGGVDAYHIQISDLNGDEAPDLVVPLYSTSQLSVMFNAGNGTFLAPVLYSTQGGSVAVVLGDWNEDGARDLAVANFSANSIQTFIANYRQSLSPDSVGYGLRVGAGYGTLSSPGDADFFSFRPGATDTVTITLEVPGRPAGSVLRCQIYDAGVNLVTEFVTDNFGQGQLFPLVLGTATTYGVRISADNGFVGPYRFRVVAAPPTDSVETEPNASPGTASHASLSSSSDGKVGTLVGGLSRIGDADYFDLGTVEAGQHILVRALPFGSATFSPHVVIRDAADQPVAETANGQALDTVAEVPIGVTGNYYATISADAEEAGPDEFYALRVRIQPSENSAPTALTLSSTSLLEGLPAATIVGELSATDADANEVASFSLVAGPGSEDNVWFAITNTSLTTTTSFNRAEASTRHVRVRVTDLGGLTFEQALTVSIVPVATVVGRYVFYDQSSWDTTADDAAIATDKVALLPGGTATLANYTSYSKGLNGIMIDVSGLGADPTPDDFEFRRGNSNDPGTWVTAPAPTSIGVRRGVGFGGSDRITLTWGSNAVKKQWLRVLLRAGAAIRLIADDVFYFGNAIGESGNSTGNAQVDLADEIGARNHPRNFLNPATITDRYDYNRDKRVDLADEILGRNNATTFLTALRLITPQALSPAPPPPEPGLFPILPPAEPVMADSTRSTLAASATTDGAQLRGLRVVRDGAGLLISVANESRSLLRLETCEDLAAGRWRALAAPLDEDRRIGQTVWRIPIPTTGAVGFFRVADGSAAGTP